MLGKIKLIFWLLAILIVAYFVSMNSEPKISITIFPNVQTKPLPLSLVIVGSIILGTVLILILTITDWIMFKIENLKSKKRIKSLEKEVKNLQERLEKCNKEKEEINSQIQNIDNNKVDAEV